MNAIDYYEVLQVSPRAHPVIVTKAYRLLAAFYHPDNRDTGDEARFKEVVDAHRALSDPVRRAAYDRERFGMGASNGYDHDGAAGPAAPARERLFEDERQLRHLIMQALYDMRRSRPYKPGLPLLALVELFGCSIDEIQFTLWYLRGKKFIELIDDNDIAITVTGVDFLEGQDGERQREVPYLASLPGPSRIIDTS